MLNTTKTHINLRDNQHVFNDGLVIFYNAVERVLKSEKARFYFSNESISYETFLQAEQNSKRDVIAIGIPEQGTKIEHGDIAMIGNTYYKVDHVQYKDYNKPEWYKVFLNSSTIPYVNEVQND